MTAAGIDQDQLDRLFTAALDAAIARVEKDGHFAPLLFELRDGDTIQAVVVLDRESSDGEEELLARFEEILRPRAAEGAMRALAIALQRSDAVEIRLRAANYAADITAPYTVHSSGFFRRKRAVELGEMRAAPATDTIFTA